MRTRAESTRASMGRNSNSWPLGCPTQLVRRRGTMLAAIVIETVGLVALVALVIFGGAKIPELARSLGRAKSEFQKGLSESKDGEDKPSGKETSENQS